jgi:hypothetical protein
MGLRPITAQELSINKRQAFDAIIGFGDARYAKQRLVRENTMPNIWRIRFSRLDN